MARSRPCVCWDCRVVPCRTERDLVPHGMDFKKSTAAAAKLRWRSWSGFGAFGGGHLKRYECDRSTVSGFGVSCGLCRMDARIGAPVPIDRDNDRYVGNIGDDGGK